MQNLFLPFLPVLRKKSLSNSDSYGMLVELTKNTSADSDGGAVWSRRKHKTQAEVKNQMEETNMSVISMKQLLEAGVHFGHQTRRWNPKMAPYIYTERNGIYIIDLQKSVGKVYEAYNAVSDRKSTRLNSSHLP